MAYRGEISKNLDYDRDILEKIDGFGKWQKILFALLWLPSGNNLWIRGLLDEKKISVNIIPQFILTFACVSVMIKKIAEM